MDALDLAFASALEQADLIRRKELSPLELTQLYLQRIQQLDGQLGSFFTVIADQSIAEATAKTEQLAQNSSDLPPLFGVPIAIKDLNAVAGVPFTFGSKALQGYVAPYDDGIVTRIRQAGCVILGKTATSEMGSLPYTEPDGFPPARNPWNLDHTAGGSSGGAAAAVAAGLLPIAQGSDGGGSIRIPACCCGIVGIKPARGRVSYAPVGDALSGLATNGSLGRTVADAAALLDVMSGYITGDPYWLPDPEIPFVEVAHRAAQAPPASLRVAFSELLPPMKSVHPLCAEAVQKIAKLLEDLGHQVEADRPDCTSLVEPFQVVWRTGVSAGNIPPEALQPFNRWLSDHNDSSGTYQKAVWAIQVMARRFVAFFDRYDVLVLPTLSQPAIRVGEWATLSYEETLERVIQWITPCPLANAAGLPSIAIPAGFTPEGLPLGVQIIGRPAAEATIIALAAQIEAANPWKQHRPAFATSLT